MYLRYPESAEREREKAKQQCRRGRKEKAKVNAKGPMQNRRTAIEEKKRYSPHQLHVPSFLHL